MSPQIPSRMRRLLKRKACFFWGRNSCSSKKKVDGRRRWMEEAGTGRAMSYRKKKDKEEEKKLDNGEWMELFLFAYLEDETEIHHRRPNNRSMHVAYLFFSHIIVDDGHRW